VAKVPPIVVWVEHHTERPLADPGAGATICGQFATAKSCGQPSCGLRALWTTQLSPSQRRANDAGVSKISVEPDSLRVTAARIDDVSTALDRASRGLTRVGSEGLAHAHLMRAIDDFVTNWEYAVHRMGAAAAATAERLRCAAETYDGTDDTVRAAAGGGR
jgi:Excreted virulence factor EspC, type VII ESX diderm